MVLEEIQSIIKKTKAPIGLNRRLANGPYPTMENRKQKTRDQRQVTRNQKPAPSDQRPGTRRQRPGTGDQNSEHGFTLLEVMVALAIMSIVLVSVYRMHSQSIAMNTTARFYTQAPLLAQYKLAELEAESDDDLSGDSGDFGDDFPGYSWQIAVNEVSSEALGEIADDLVRVDISVYFNENENSYNLRTYRFLRE